MVQNVTLILQACVGALAGLTFVLAGCSSDPADVPAANEPRWRAVNQRVIEDNKVTGRTRELPDVNVPMRLADGEPVERHKLPVITIAPGVTAALSWGRGALLERVEMQPNAAYPAQTLAEELIIIVEDGSATVE